MRWKEGDGGPKEGCLETRELTEMSRVKQIPAGNYATARVAIWKETHSKTPSSKSGRNRMFELLLLIFTLV